MKLKIDDIEVDIQCKILAYVANRNKIKIADRNRIFPTFGIDNLFFTFI